MLPLTYVQARSRFTNRQGSRLPVPSRDDPTESFIHITILIRTILIRTLQHYRATPGQKPPTYPTDAPSGADPVHSSLRDLEAGRHAVGAAILAVELANSFRWAVPSKHPLSAGVADIPARLASLGVMVTAVGSWLAAVGASRRGGS